MSIPTKISAPIDYIKYDGPDSRPTPSPLSVLSETSPSWGSPLSSSSSKAPKG